MKRKLILTFILTFLIMSGFLLPAKDIHPLKINLVKYSLKRGNLKLPEGISLLTKANNSDFFKIGNYKLINGNGGFIKIRKSFVNSTHDNINVTLPAGLTFISATPGAANAIILKNIVFEVEAFSTVHVEFYGFSLSHVGNHSVGAEDSYDVGPITEDLGLIQIVFLVENLETDENRIGSKEENDRSWYISTTLQSAINSVLEQGYLSNEAIKSINELYRTEMRIAKN
jgi:hypothetical protein